MNLLEFNLTTYLETNMSTTSKIVWTLGLLCAFLLILVTGRTNVRNFEKVQSSIEEIYKDRLVVKGLIFELSSLIHRKEVAILSKDESFYLHQNTALNGQISELISAFRETKLTPQEEEALDRFSMRVKNLLEQEMDLTNSKEVQTFFSQESKVRDIIGGLEEDLKLLSGIQLLEGKKKLSLSDRAIDSMNTFERVENYMLIIFGVLMSALIFIVPGPKQEED